MLIVLMALLGLNMTAQAGVVTYDFAAAAANLEADVTLTASDRAAGSNNMGTALVFANELQDLFQDQIGFFFRNECTVTLSKEEGGLAMVGTKDTYMSVLNLKAGDKVTITYPVGSILFCDKPGQNNPEGLTNVEGITEQWAALNSDQAYTMLVDGNFNFQWKKSKTVITKIVVESAAEDNGAVFDFNASSHAVSSSESGDGDILEPYVETVNGVTLTVSPADEGVSNPNRFWGTNAGPQLRCYSGTITIESESTIKSIEFDAPSKFDLTPDVGELSSTTWSGEATKVVFTVNKNTQINKITVSADAAVIPSLPVAATIAEFKALEKGTEATLTLAQAYVTAVSGNNAYVQDATGALYFYNTGLTLEAGTVLNGAVTGKLDVYNSLPEFVKTADTNADGFTVAEGTATPKVITVDEALMAENVSMLVKIAKVDIVEEDGKYYAVSGEDKIQIYDQFKVLGAEFVYPEKADIVAIIGMYKGTPQLYPLDENSITEPFALPEITDGKYFLNNLASAKFWGCGNDWGTRASLVKHPEFVTLLKQPDGTYFLESQVSNGGNAIYFEGDYMDNGSPKALVITALEEPIGYSDANETQPVYGYTIATTDGQYFGYDGTSTILGKNIDITSEEGLQRAIWIIASEAQALEAMKDADLEDTFDATFLIQDPNFGRNNRYYDAWQKEGTVNNPGGDNTNFCVESFHADFTMSQTLENVPNGVYKMQAQGFYRQDGEDNEHLPVFFLNDATTVFPQKTGNENSMANASVSFTNGLYTCEPIYAKVENGTITLGAKLEGNTNLWCIWDNFELTYYGPEATIEQAKAAALIEELEDLQDLANELLDKVDNETVKANLAAAIVDAALVSPEAGEEAVKAVIAELSAAVDLAEGNVAAQNVLPAMKALVDATNVYTQEALNDYFTQWYDKYQAGTITKVEAGALQNPDVVTGWHAAITVDDFLLSAWDTNPDFNNAPYYINSWSVEGDNDGSNFHVPFFEYWTGDGDSLGERTLTATMNNLDEGNYDVTAWVRVRAKNGYQAPAYGITMQANDGAEVNVAAGKQIGDTQFYLDTFTASGAVGADGVLKIKFNVAADNNISWLSFKNVVFKAAAAADDPELKAPEGWTSLISNGNLAGDDVANFFSKEAPAGEPSPSVITPGAGKNGSRGITVQSADSPAQGWDTQFFIRFNEKLPEGTKLHVEFDYKADKNASASTQSHTEPGNYIHWAAIGTVSFTPEWQHYSADVTLSAEMNDMQTIAFNLAEETTATLYSFDNFGIWMQKPAPVDDWVNILANSDLEGTDASSFFSKEAPSTEVVPSTIYDGAGVDGSRGIKVTSIAGAAQDWDTQFWIYMPCVLPEGTKYLVEFDYKADKDATADTQAHGEPGNYIFYSMIGSPSFTTEWQHYKKSGSISADQAGGGTFRSIAFNLSKDKANDVTFFFDNIKFCVEKDFYETGIFEVTAVEKTAEGIYNLRGQRVDKPVKGLYIVNGRKVMIK